jgi:hypothetical protein
MTQQAIHIRDPILLPVPIAEMRPTQDHGRDARGQGEAPTDRCTCLDPPG